MLWRAGAYGRFAPVRQKQRGAMSLYHLRMQSSWLTRFALIPFMVAMIHDQGAAAVCSQAPFDEAQAMRLWLGNYDAISGASTTTIPDDAQLDLTGSTFERGDTIRVMPFWKSGYLEGGTRKVILLTYALPDVGPFDCHACAPLIGMAVLRQSEHLRSSAGLRCST